MPGISPIPPGYTAVTPYLIVPDAVALLDFLRDAFGAVEVRRTPGPGGIALNVEARIRDAMLMLVHAREGHALRTADLYHYVADVDGVYRAAVSAGGRPLMEPEDQFYGERQAGVEDPAGNRWWISARTEELTTEELAGRAASR